jgi:hypothetical protein
VSLGASRKPEENVLIVLDLTAYSGERPEGTATWDGLPAPVPFAGVLELLALLEDAVAGPNGVRG